MKKVAVLVSGGVDSSVALRLLQDQGYDVTAFYLKIWLEDDLSFLGTCPWEDDLKQVNEVCEQAKVPLKIVSLQRAYLDRVVSYTVDEVRAGRTPNPDIMCNQRIKFGAFFDVIGGEYDLIATGHYAKVARLKDDCVELHCSPDPVKDQTYFLSYLSQNQLKKLIFPLGDLTKEQVRELARRYDLPNKARKDSQGLCFLGKIKFRDFVKHHVGVQPGDIIEYETGVRLGSHDGFYFYTLGQRQGLGLAGGPWYVVSKDQVSNRVFVSKNYFSDDKIRNELKIDKVSWFSGTRSDLTELKIKLRHGPQYHDGRLRYHADGSITITLAQRDQGIAPGQFAALYDGPVCLGAGIIV
ncbi:tRNA 2-thiouridine(34) synthase MnmA [Candidatus Babeliales bacterium]|nr:tRNA 2-thiouridine(34) synthase MnmA [Candidatus Babeliales bacterium]